MKLPHVYYTVLDTFDGGRFEYTTTDTVKLFLGAISCICTDEGIVSLSLISPEASFYKTKKEVSRSFLILLTLQVTRRKGHLVG